MRKLRAREFHQIAGRAGRSGFDTEGMVIAEAPEHEIENAKLMAKAGDDPKKLRKIKKKKAPEGFVTWNKQTYTKLYRYRAETTYVLGEFYWPVVRGDTTDNVDFARGDTQAQLLNMEQNRREVSWSMGRKLAPETVAAAFGMTDQLALFKPSSSEFSLPKLGCLPIVIGLLILFFLVVWLWPSGCDAAEERRKMAADPSYVSKCSSSS